MNLLKTAFIFFFMFFFDGKESEQNITEPGIKKAFQSLAKTAETTAPNATAAKEPYIGRLTQRESKTIQVELGANRCYTFIAIGEDGLSDLSMVIFEDGKELGSDRVSGKSLLVKWCAAKTETVDVMLTAYAGSGTYVVGVYMEPAKAIQKADIVGGAAGDLISGRIKQLHSRFGKGRAAISSVFRGNVSTDENMTFKIMLKKGHCYTLIGAGDQSVRDLDVSLIDIKGNERSKDDSHTFFVCFDTDPCIKSNGEYTIKVGAASGSGQFGVQVFSD